MLHCLRSHSNCSVNVLNDLRFRYIFKNRLYSNTNIAQKCPKHKNQLKYSTIHRRFLHLSAVPANFITSSNEPGRYESNAVPRHARIVICGGGAMGAAVAYHLAEQGLGHETVLLEQDRFVNFDFIETNDGFQLIFFLSNIRRTELEVE